MKKSLANWMFSLPILKWGRLRLKVKATVFAWHIHHNILLEPLFEPIEKRREYIKQNKPITEQPLRLQLLKVVKGKLPEQIFQASQAYNQAWRAYQQASRAYNQAWQAYQQASQAHDQVLQAYKQTIQKYNAEIIALHAIECPNCSWNGVTILSNQDTEP